MIKQLISVKILSHEDRQNNIQNSAFKRSEPANSVGTTVCLLDVFGEISRDDWNPKKKL